MVIYRVFSYTPFGSSTYIYASEGDALRHYEEWQNVWDGDPNDFDDGALRYTNQSGYLVSSGTVLEGERISYIQVQREEVIPTGVLGYSGARRPPQQ